MSSTATRPENLGVSNGRLAACPDSPNCVSSQVDESDSHYIAPLPFVDGSFEKTRSAVMEYLEELPRTSVVVDNEDYLHAECTSMIFRFVDDLEIAFDRDAGVVHFRSASRVGHSDLGANRKRVERLKQTLSAD